MVIQAALLLIALQWAGYFPSYWVLVGLELNALTIIPWCILLTKRRASAVLSLPDLLYCVSVLLLSYSYKYIGAGFILLWREYKDNSNAMIGIVIGLKILLQFYQSVIVRIYFARHPSTVPLIAKFLYGAKVFSKLLTSMMFPEAGSVEVCCVILALSLANPVYCVVKQRWKTRLTEGRALKVVGTNLKLFQRVQYLAFAFCVEIVGSFLVAFYILFSTIGPNHSYFPTQAVLLSDPRIQRAFLFILLRCLLNMAAFLLFAWYQRKHHINVALLIITYAFESMCPFFGTNAMVLCFWAVLLHAGMPHGEQNFVAG